MSTLTGLISAGGGGGGTPINGVASFNKPITTTTFTDESDQVWLRMGAKLYGDSLTLYPDVDVNEDGITFRVEVANSHDELSTYGPATDYSPYAMTFKPDGTRAYFLTSSRNVVEYELTTPWDVNTLTYNSVKVSVGGSFTTTSFRFKPDGTKMYVLRSWTGGYFQISEHSLSTAWDINTLSLINTYNFTEFGSIDVDTFVFAEDGSWFFAIANTSSTYRLYRMTTPWDVSTASHNTSDVAIGLSGVYTAEVDFSTNKMLLGTSSSGRIYQYRLTVDASSFSVAYDGKQSTNWRIFNGRLIYARYGFEEVYTADNSSTYGGIYKYAINKNIGYIDLTNFVNTDYVRIK